MDELIYIWPTGDYCNRWQLTDKLKQGLSTNYESLTAEEFYSKSVGEWVQELFND